MTQAHPAAHPFAPDLLKAKTVLVTGGASGLGLAMARTFMALGADVLICARRKDRLRKVSGELEARFGRPVNWAVADLRSADEVEAVFDRFFAEAPPDVLVNNAAANFVARSETLSHRAVDAIVDSSLKTALYCTLAAGRRWIEGNANGTVLSIVTSYAWHGSPYVVPSAAAKAGVLAMTRSLASEWGPKGIRVNAIAPGSFPTAGAWERLVPRAGLAGHHETNNALGRPGKPEELATLAAFLISDAAAYIHGECVTIDGGRWLHMAGTFGFLRGLSDDDWDAMGPKR